MTVTFTLNSTYLGTEAGPFNISGTTDSNVTTELITNLSLADLTTGHTISGINDNTTGFTIQSVGTCINYVVKPVLGNVPYVPCTDGMDVVFLVDYTGSMGGAIDGVKSSISNIASTIVTESNNNYRLGLVIFDEYTSPTDSTYDDKVDYTSLPLSQRYVNTGINGHYQWITAVEMMSSNNQTSFTTQLNKLNTINFPLGSGGNIPEPSDIGVDLVGLNGFANSFRSGVARLVVLITDATPGGNDDNYTQTDIDFVNGLVPQLVSQGVRVLLMTTAATNVLYDLATGTNGVISNGFSGTDIITAIENVCVAQYQYTLINQQNPTLQLTCDNDGTGGTISLISTSNALTVGDMLYFTADPSTYYVNNNEGYSVKVTNVNTGIAYAVEFDLNTGIITAVQECLPAPTPTATVTYGVLSVGFLSEAEACENSNLYVNAVNGGTFNGGTDLCDSTSYTFSEYETQVYNSSAMGWLSNGTNSRVGFYDHTVGIFTFSGSCVSCTSSPTPTATAGSGNNDFVAVGSNRSIACNPLTNPSVTVYYGVPDWNSLSVGNVLYTGSDFVTPVSDDYYYNVNAFSGREVVRMLEGVITSITDCAGNTP